MRSAQALIFFCSWKFTSRILFQKTNARRKAAAQAGSDTSIFTPISPSAYFFKSLYFAQGSSGVDQFTARGVGGEGVTSCFRIGALLVGVGARAALPAATAARLFWAEAHVPQMSDAAKIAL